MSYRDPASEAQSERRQEIGRTALQARWSWVVVAAIVLAFGLAFYAINASRNGPKTANPSAVMAVPAPAAGVAPPAPQTMTGQAAPPAAPETTGRGEAPPRVPR
jgi:hypothetical protein